MIYKEKIYKHSLSNLATSITSLKNSTKNNKRLWTQGHISVVTTPWNRQIWKVLWVFWYRIFTCKFIAPMFSDPPLDSNYKTEVLSLIMPQGNIVFLRLRNGRTVPLFPPQPWKDDGWQQWGAHHGTRGDKSPGLFRTLWFRGWDRKLIRRLTSIA